MADWKREIRERIAVLRLDPAREMEIVDEYAQHFDDRHQELMDSGETDESASRIIRLELQAENFERSELPGVVVQAPADAVQASRGNWLRDFSQDTRYGFRSLRNNLGFTIAAILTLALGIGANTAIFSVVNALILRPLPFHNPERLVMMWGAAPGADRTGFSEPNFLDYQDRNHSFEHMATFHGASVMVTGGTNPEKLRAGKVTADFFKVLEVQPVLGRLFLPEESQAGKENVAVLGYSLWQRRFNADPTIAGRTIELDRKTYTITGVLPRDFDFSVPGVFHPAQLWIPAVLTRDQAQRNHNYLYVIARLKHGVSFSQAQSDLNGITIQLVNEYSQRNSGSGASIVPLHQQIVTDIRSMVWILFGVVGFVLLIACANVANLQLARASARQKEIAIRAALGAGGGRMVRQLLTESVLLALLGGLLGIALAAWGIQMLSALGLNQFALGKNLGIDFTVLAYSLVLSVFTGILFGLFPAIHSVSPRLAESFKEGGRTSGAATGGRSLRSVMIVSEIALSAILLIGAGLLIRSFVRLAGVEPGFATKNILTTFVSLPKFAYPETSQQAMFYTRTLERLRALHGVDAVGAIDDLPLTPDRDSTTFSVDGMSFSASQLPLTQMRSVTHDYFRVMGMPVVQGRDFTATDTESSLPVAMINRSLAQRIFGNQDPLGRRINFDSSLPAEGWMTIVGVVEDVHDLGLDAQAEMEVYQPYRQSTLPYMNFVVRSAEDQKLLAADMRAEIHELDKDLPPFSVQTMEEVMSESLSDRRSSMTLLAIFAAVALLLAAIGIYGVISYSVIRQTHDIGVRLALGAQVRDVFGLVIGQGLRFAAIGIAIGLTGAFGLTRVLTKLLFGVTATDPLTFAGVSLLLVSVALLACYVPARRAMRVDPLLALHYE